MGRASGAERLAFTPASRALYCRPDGTPKQVGDHVVNRDLGQTLRLIAKHGDEVFYEGESPDQSNWEYTAMAFGRAFSGSASDPLFGRFFWIATILNFIPAALAGAVPTEWMLIGLAHAVFIARVVVAERHVRRAPLAERCALGPDDHHR